LQWKVISKSAWNEALNHNWMLGQPPQSVNELRSWFHCRFASQLAATCQTKSSLPAIQQLLITPAVTTHLAT